jgi:hypothetical protein
MRIEKERLRYQLDQAEQRIVSLPRVEAGAHSDASNCMAQSGRLQNLSFMQAEDPLTRRLILLSFVLVSLMRLDKSRLSCPALR